ncbi:hypothetical protein [Streptomyces sp. MMBL 11-1]|uniref:hypothetical protein n=1 Tax=Streptomyces sp. MMBL 11-1 TaxID=3026420 RepID=UPI00235FCCD1|nr:hypothetical protein [Streptomyces sp. MMBL 11-1]
MRALANTTISVLRGTTTDEFGDPVDAPTTVASGIPASLIEVTRRAFTPENPTPRVVRYSIARTGADVDVLEDDRIRDESTDRIYIVEAVSQTGGIGMVNDLRLDLKQTT